MKLFSLSQHALADAMHSKGIALQIGPFSVHVRSRIDYVTSSLLRLYADYKVLPDDGFHDFHVSIERPHGFRGFFKPQSLFFVDDDTPFKPLPLNQAYPFFEWGLNWCVAQYAHQFLILHAAVVEKDGIAAILPGNPGAGKSTLCASLVARGWRLLSDEMALIPATDNVLTPIPRPVSLKNNSIDLIKSFAPDVVFGDSYHDTAKGSIAHMQPPIDSIEKANESAKPRLLIFPLFDSKADVSMTRFSKAESFLKLIEYSFNYDFLGPDGFNRMNRLITACDCYNFTYSSLETGLNGLSRLWEETLSSRDSL